MSIRRRARAAVNALAPTPRTQRPDPDTRPAPPGDAPRSGGTVADLPLRSDTPTRRGRPHPRLTPPHPETEDEQPCEQ
ncbi:hypothetical protein GCM10010441_02180 [Kitasatospora paracochleata]